MAASKYLNIDNIINGQMGTAIMTPTYGTYAGMNIELFDIVTIRGHYEAIEITGRTLNYRGEQTKDSGYRLTFDMELYNCRPEFLKIINEYMKNGVQIRFDILLSNDGTNEGLGTQRVKMKNCKITSGDLFALDVNNDMQTLTYSGKFDDYDILDEFTAPSVSATP